jgi:hypothetical protein
MLSVREPDDKTEFEVQAYLWNELNKLGINARGEVKTKYEKRAYVRFDVAIFENGNLKQIIEVKRSKIKHKTSWEDTRQGRRYSNFGVPVTILYGMDDVNRYLLSLKK